MAIYDLQLVAWLARGHTVEHNRLIRFSEREWLPMDGYIWEFGGRGNQLGTKNTMCVCDSYVRMLPVGALL